MPRALMILSLVFVSAACQQAERDAPAADSADEQGIPVHVTPSIAYEHAWADRSALWEAVLFEHAKKGYFDMPAHGLDGRFSDEEIAAAAQYMLEITHPDRPRD